MTNRRPSLFAFLLALLLWEPGAWPAAQTAAGAAAQTPASQTPTFRTRIDSVVVDVSVMDRDGRPVTDLTAADFEIREGGKPQTIDTFKLIRIDQNAPEPVTPREIVSMADQIRETADEQNRLFIVLLDDYHVRKSNSLRVREQLARFISQLSSRDLVAVMYPLTPIQAATFTRHHDGTAAAMMNFIGRKYDYTPRNAFEERYQQQPPETQERMRNELTLSALENACRFLASLREGRKTLLFVSEGMSGSLPAGVNTTGVGRPAGLPPSPSQQFFNSTELLTSLRQVFVAAARANTSIYTLDPRGLASSEFDIADNVMFADDRVVLNESMDTLKTLADQTDGRAIVNRNDPLPELRRMVTDMSAYYLLGYTSTLAPRDGKFHPIQVRVKRRDVDIRARKGYWAWTAEEVDRATAPAKAGPPREIVDALEEMTAIVEPAARRPVIVWMGAERGASERALVTLAWEASGPPSDPDEAIERVTVTAHAISGEMLHTGVVARDLQSPRPAGRVTFEAPAGSVRVRVVPENAHGHRLDSEDASFDVPDFTATGPQTSPPAVFRGRTARDIQDLRASAAPLPAATRQFSRAERLLLRFQAYGPAGTTPTIAMRLLNRLGDSIVALPAPTRTTGATFETELGLGGLPPGDYLIEIAATVGTETSKKLMAIRVTG
jgi:VWFA-related protein